MIEANAGGTLFAPSAVSGGSSLRIAVIVSAAVSRLKGPASREHLEEHGAKGEDVGATIDRVTPDLLGRHVADGPHDRTGFV